MHSSKQPRQGQGCFQWNLGGWFGSIIGSTAWMLVTAGFLIVNRQSLVAVVPIGCFLATNVLGWILWTRRDRLDPFYALMAILSVIAVVLPVAWIAIATWSSPIVLEQMNWPSSPIWNAAVVLIIPTGMVWFYLRERQARNVTAGNDTHSDDAT